MDLTAIGAAGLNVAQSRFEKAATGLAAASVDNTTADSVSLSRQAVSLLSARTEFRTDAKLVHLADDMQKTVLNLLA